VRMRRELERLQVTKVARLQFLYDHGVLPRTRPSSSARQRAPDRAFRVSAA
jgi:hypothetical protein